MSIVSIYAVLSMWHELSQGAYLNRESISPHAVITAADKERSSDVDLRDRKEEDIAKICVTRFIATIGIGILLVLGGPV